MQDTEQIKQKIISIIQQRGPSLPVHISKEIEQSILFTSAFLAELISEKKINMTQMRVGNSPIYYLSEQKPQIDKYSQHLKSKEKDAFEHLKEKKILKDTEQHPAIRVALRHIRDFAIPFKHNDEIYWRFFTIPESDFKPKPIESIPEPAPEKPLEIFDEKEPEEKEEPEEKPIKKKITKRKTTASQKKNEKFFEKVKDYLNSKQIEITGIVGFSKNDLLLKIQENSKAKLLVAFNKKKITEKDLLNAHKKAQEMNLTYKIFSLGEQTKKMTNLVEAIKNLDDIETIS